MTAKKAKSKLTDAELKEATRMILCLFGEFGATIRGSLKYPEKEYKLYELYCVYELLKWMEHRYNVNINPICGDKVIVRQKAEEIDKSVLYFEVTNNDGSVNLEVHMNVHFLTLGSCLASVKTNKYTDILKGIRRMKNAMRFDKVKCLAEKCGEAEHKKMMCGNCKIENSFLHEIDICVIEKHNRYKHPLFNMILLGIECKNHSRIDKRIIREALGVRRELSFYCPMGKRWNIDRIFGHKGSATVNAYPSSLYWLACPDCRILNYTKSPEVFGVTMQCWKPPWKDMNSDDHDDVLGNAGNMSL